MISISLVLSKKKNYVYNLLAVKKYFKIFVVDRILNQYSDFNKSHYRHHMIM